MGHHLIGFFLPTFKPILIFHSMYITIDCIKNSEFGIWLFGWRGTMETAGNVFRHSQRKSQMTTARKSTSRRFRSRDFHGIHDNRREGRGYDGGHPDLKPSHSHYKRGGFNESRSFLETQRWLLFSAESQSRGSLSPILIREKAYFFNFSRKL